MSTSEWFRNSEWNDEIRSAFWLRLNRSRSDFHKAQYARIQAFHLAEDIGTPSALQEAVALLREVRERWPVVTEMQMVCNQMADCYLRLGQIPEAIDAFRRAMDALRAKPSVQTNCHLHFAFFVAVERKADLFKEGITALDEFCIKRSPFPICRFQEAAARALILYEGQDSDARRWAEKAIEEASAQQSDFTRHKRLGLVGTKFDAVVKRLHTIAA